MNLFKLTHNSDSLEEDVSKLWNLYPIQLLIIEQ